MYLGRAALQRFSPLIKSSITHRTILHRDAVPRRLMSSVPGGTGENLVYIVLCGSAFAGALIYAYRTVASDSARFSDRIREIEARPKNNWKPKTWPPKNAEEAMNIAEEEVEPATEPPAEGATEPPAALVEFVGQVEAEKPDSVVKTAAEAVAVAAERVVEDVTAVVQEVEKIVEKVEAPVVKEESANTEA